MMGCLSPRIFGSMVVAMLVLTATLEATPAESAANSGASLAPPTTGPFEQKPIRRSGASASGTTSGKGSAGSTNSAWDMGKVPLALGGVLMLILGMRALGKKMVPGASGAGSSKAVAVLMRSSVSPRQQLILVRVGRRLVLVGCGGGGEMNPLCQIDDPDEVAEVMGQIREDKSMLSSKNFTAMFGKAGKAYEEPPSSDEPVALPAVTRNSGEDLNGLTERVRRIAEQFQGS